MSEEQKKHEGVAAVGDAENHNYDPNVIYQTTEPGTYKVPYQTVDEDGIIHYAGHCDFHLLCVDSPKITRTFFADTIVKLLKMHEAITL